jgi:hypothetical protein
MKERKKKKRIETQRRRTSTCAGWRGAAYFVDGK